MASNGGGPWGGGGQNDDDENKGRDGRRELDDLMRKGQETLKVLIGGRGGNNRPNGTGYGAPGGPQFNRKLAVLGGLGALVALWLFNSVYTVRPDEKSVEFFLGKSSGIGTEGLNFAPWPFVTKDVISVTSQRIEAIGVAPSANTEVGLMLTTDENIVDVDFEVIWNISDPAKYLFALKEPEKTVAAVAESAMRELVAATELAPLLNRDRDAIAMRAQELIQTTLDSYDSGIMILRVNLYKVEPPNDVKDAFRDVQAAEQDRIRLVSEADAYANQVRAAARGQAAELSEKAAAYRTQTENDAVGAASRFLAVLAEYRLAPEVTRKRLYLETMERVLGTVDKIILDNDAAGGVLPYLPLNDMQRKPTTGGN